MFIKLRHCFLYLVCSGSLLACNFPNSGKNFEEDIIVTSNHAGLSLGHIDPSTRPQDDFYQYANGTWLKTTEIPEDKPSYGTFIHLSDKAEADLKQIMDDLLQKEVLTEGEKKVRDLYKSFMDTDSLETKGLEAIQVYLADIDKIDSRQKIYERLSFNIKNELSNLFYTSVFTDKKNSAANIVYLDQGGLALPDQDYYLKEDEKFKDIRKKYRQFLSSLLNLAGVSYDEKNIEELMAFETKIAKIQWSKVENRDPHKTYNSHQAQTLKKLAPNMPWDDLFQSLGFSASQVVVVKQPSFLAGVDKLLSETPIPLLRLYFKKNFITRFAPYLSKNFSDAHFDFYGKTLSGVPQERIRWKKGLDLVEDALGEELGKIYVAKHFKPESKQKMEALVKNLIVAMGKTLDSLPWMEASTKAQAKEKLNQFTYKIGYPIKWEDYSRLAIDEYDLIGNLFRANQWQYQRSLEKLNLPVDKDEWHMTPQTVNAYFNPTGNEIVFPAAILQPPFFNPMADDAVNYGAIGVVIGHEITHGFDDQGRKYDGKGNLRDWWTLADEEKFKTEAKKLEEQFNQFTPLADMHINGALTLGENLADLGGLLVAFRAYQSSQDSKSEKIIDGFTGAQRFFLSNAQIWAGKYREATLRQVLLTNPHSPGEYRILGPFKHVEEFYQAFDVQPKDAMYMSKEKRVNIW